MLPRLTYPPFTTPNAIRILQLDDAHDCSAPLVGSLEEHDFDPKNSKIPEYSALSYVWGPSDASNLRDVSIRVQGGQLCRVSVTSNCIAALRHMRQRGHPVWVDAICIDQQSNAEKSAQVAMMQDIYYHAPNVAIWFQLGENPDLIEEKELEKLIKHFQRLAWLCSRGFVQLKPWPFEIRGKRLSTYLSSRGSSLRPILLKFLSSSYFQRAWTVQESVVPRLRIVDFVTSINTWSFGGVVMGLNLLAYTIGQDLNHDTKLKALLTSRGLLWNPSHIVSYLRSGTYRLSASIPDFGWFNYHLHMMRASEPRDRVYSALWQIQEPNSEAVLVPDYSRPVGQVFADFSKVFIQRHGLQLLYFAFQKQRREGLPTWSPDWEYEPTATEDGFATRLLGSNYERGITADSIITSRPSHPPDKPTFLGNTLHLRGYPIDAISHVFQFHLQEAPRHEIEASPYGEYLNMALNIHAALKHFRMICEVLNSLSLGEGRRKMARLIAAATTGRGHVFREPTAFEIKTLKAGPNEDFTKTASLRRWGMLYAFAQVLDQTPPGVNWSVEEREEHYVSLANLLLPVLGYERALEVIRVKHALRLLPAEFILRLMLAIDDEIPVCEPLKMICFGSDIRESVLFFTKTGLVGSSLAANVGDELVVSESRQTTIILHELASCDNDETTYRLVSLAFLSDMCDSELEENQLKLYKIL